MNKGIAPYLFYFFPVRGRKRYSLFDYWLSRWCIYFISSPSGDGNYSGFWFSSQEGFYLFYFFPVRGRKHLTIGENNWNIITIYFISSPSGDGNVIAFCRKFRIKRYLFYFFPVRGRKHYTYLYLYSVYIPFILFLPRQGTETYRISQSTELKRLLIYFISSPSGDGNLPFGFWTVLTKPWFILFLPRQGTETFLYP